MENRQRFEFNLRTGLRLVGVGVWGVGCACILHRYSDDPSTLIEMINRVALPVGNKLIRMIRGSLVLVLQAANLNAFMELWSRYKSGQLRDDLEKVLVTEDLKKLAELEGKKIDFSIEMSEDDYRKTCRYFRDTLDLKPVKIFGEMGDGEKKFNVPSSLAVSVNGEVIITDHLNHRLVTFNADGNYVRQFGGQGTGDGQLLDHPWGVVMCGNHVLVSDNPGFKCGRIQEFDMDDGAYIRTIYRQEQVTLRELCVTDDRIAVCCMHLDDKTKSGIKLLSKESGHVVQEIPTADKTPWYIAYGSGKYFVTYFEKYFVDVYDASGTFLYKIVDKGKEGVQIDFLRGLTVFGGDKLLVCDGRKHRVQIWTQEGQLLESFGSRGSSLGQMDKPANVVVTPDGKVLVLERDGKRVQVWQ